MDAHRIAFFRGVMPVFQLYVMHRPCAVLVGYFLYVAFFNSVDNAEVDAGTACLIGIEYFFRTGAFKAVARLFPCKVVCQNPLAGFDRRFFICFPVIDDIPVGGHHRADIFGAFHSSFYFKGCNSRLDKIGDIFNEL